MISPLSMHGGLLQTNQLSTLGGAEKPGEMENDGDSDDAGAGGAITNSAAMNNLPSFLGSKVNTLA